ncbi:aminoglycoside adenylyltransferase domain-containing protein [Providencia sp. PROV255]|uniref:aminoglycoside adenylyltransferase domain-containing protein n=1 Tax=Providencia sp. PROV255 TaxID=2949943 RepID=UPI00234A3E77|nr:aminoglycoside adenylyltransferase domain-containing protein [Providencia sp. PROV255]
MDESFQIEHTLGILKSFFQGNLKGIYLHGSSVLNGRKPTSDIDFLVLIEEPMTDYERRTLISQLMPLSGRYPHDDLGRPPLEVAVFLCSDLKDLNYPARCEFIYGEWLRKDFEEDIFYPADSNPEYTLMLAQAKHYSKPCNNLNFPLPTVDQEQIRQAILDCLPQLTDSLNGDERNVLLTMARMWFTMQSGHFISKDEAADWILGQVPYEYTEVIKAARDSYLNGNQVDWASYQEILPHLVAFLTTKIQSIK